MTDDSAAVRPDSVLLADADTDTAGCLRRTFTAHRTGNRLTALRDGRPYWPTYLRRQGRFATADRPI